MARPTCGCGEPLAWQSMRSCARGTTVSSAGDEVVSLIDGFTSTRMSNVFVTLPALFCPMHV